MTLSDSAKSIRSASESSESTGQMSMFGETCERLAKPMWSTPRASDVAAGRLLDERGNRTNASRTMTYGANLADQVLASSPQAIPASHSHSPGSDWARRMTATYGRKLSGYWLSSDPPDSWVRTLLATSTWASTTCYLTWKKSVTPHGRLLFRLVPSTPRTAGIGSGLWPTPDTPSGGRTMPEGTTPTGRTPDGRKVTVGLENAARMWPTPSAMEGRTLDRDQLVERRERAKENARNGNGFGLTLGNAIAMDGAPPNMKLNSAWVSRMMGYPDSWLDLTLDGEAIP